MTGASTVVVVVVLSAAIAGNAVLVAATRLAFMDPGVYCSAVCSVQCSKTNSKREKQRMCVKTGEVPTLLPTRSCRFP